MNKTELLELTKQAQERVNKLNAKAKNIVQSLEECIPENIKPIVQVIRQMPTALEGANYGQYLAEQLSGINAIEGELDPEMTDKIEKNIKRINTK